MHKFNWENIWLIWQLNKLKWTNFLFLFNFPHEHRFGRRDRFHYPRATDPRTIGGIDGDRAALWGSPAGCRRADKWHIFPPYLFSGWELPMSFWESLRFLFAAVPLRSLHDESEHFHLTLSWYDGMMIPTMRDGTKSLKNVGSWCVSTTHHLSGTNPHGNNQRCRKPLLRLEAWTFEVHRYLPIFDSFTMMNRNGFLQSAFTNNMFLLVIINNS